MSAEADRCAVEGDRLLRCPAVRALPPHAQGFAYVLDEALGVVECAYCGADATDSREPYFPAGAFVSAATGAP